MWNKQKAKKLYEQGEAAAKVGNYRLALPVLKQVIAHSLKNRRYYDYAFKSFITLGDIYLDAGLEDDSKHLYQMAAGINRNARFILPQKELPHTRAANIRKKREWLSINRIDATSIVKSTSKKGLFSFGKAEPAFNKRSKERRLKSAA